MRAAMRAQGVTQVELGRLTGASQAGISQALSPTQQTSKYVAAICEALDVPLPIAVLDDELIARFYDAAMRVHAAAPGALQATVRQLEALADALDKKGDD